MFTALISVTDLAAHLHDPQWIVFDCRYDLVDPAAGSRAYAQAHINGARLLHLEHDLSGTKTPKPQNPNDIIDEFLVG